MEPFEPRNYHGPEFYIQGKWINFLKAKKWHIERLTGNISQYGIPDVYIAHNEFGTRWVDFKVYGKYAFTKAQKIKWPIWEQYNIGIWILGASSKEECNFDFMSEEYKKLFGKPNWRDYWKSSWDQQPTIDELLEECDNALEESNCGRKSRLLLE